MPLPPHHLSLHKNPDWCNLSGASLPCCSGKRPLNGCLSVCLTRKSHRSKTSMRKPSNRGSPGKWPLKQWVCECGMQYSLKPLFSDEETYSRVKGFRPAGRQKTNCIVLHMRWNSTLVSTFHAPLQVVSVSQIGSLSRTWRKRCSQKLKTDRPDESFSLVIRLVSCTMWTCYTINRKHTHAHFKQFTNWQLLSREKKTDNCEHCVWECVSSRFNRSPANYACKVKACISAITTTLLTIL